MRKTSSEENVKRQPSNKVALFADCASNNVEENNDQNIATDCQLFFWEGNTTKVGSGETCGSKLAQDAPTHPHTEQKWPEIKNVHTTVQNKREKKKNGEPQVT